MSIISKIWDEIASGTLLGISIYCSLFGLGIALLIFLLYVLIFKLL